MCSHYEVPHENRLLQYFGVQKPAGTDSDIWPGKTGTLIFRSGNCSKKEIARAGIFGLIPHWAKDTSFSRHTFNARIETVDQKASFRDAWHRSQRCIIPAEAIFEPDWSSGKSVSTRIIRADHRPMGIAGLWSVWGKEEIYSFSMLTVNADNNGFMRQFHKPGKEKRTVVVLPETSYQDWLNISHQEAKNFVNWCTVNQSAGCKEGDGISLIKFI